TANTRVNLCALGVPGKPRPKRTSNTAPMTVPTSTAQWAKPYGLNVGATVGRYTSATLGGRSLSAGRSPPVKGELGTPVLRGRRRVITSGHHLARLVRTQLTYSRTWF